MEYKIISRREFLQTAGVATLVFTFSPVVGYIDRAFAYEISRKKYTNFFTSPVGEARKLLIKARQLSQYTDDKIVRKEFKLAASHENPMIKKFYHGFCKHPISEISEKLLHTEYVKRRV